MMTITKDGKTTTANHNPAYVFVQITGGGNTAQQTAKAMELMAQYAQTGCVEYKGFTIKAGAQQ